VRLPAARAGPPGACAWWRRGGVQLSNDDGFRRMVKDFADGRVDVVIMHIDTTKLLDPEEWEQLKAAGATVVVVHKALPDEAG